jgi:hypothetical protein
VKRVSVAVWIAIVLLIIVVAAVLASLYVPIFNVVSVIR